MANELIFAEERHSKILSLLKTKNKLLVNELCEYFSVSPATIRNDLNELEKQGLLKRTHGGAIPSVKIGFEPTTVQKTVSKRDEKMKIASFAADMVENGDTLAIDTGTTTLYLAKMLATKENITVVTNDLKIAEVLEGYAGTTVILCGGMVRKGFSCTTGSLTTAMLHNLSVDKAFIATNSVNAKFELCSPNLEQSEVKRTLMQISSQVILLCDSSKFGNKSFAKFGDISELDCVITDAKIEPTIVDEIKNKGINIEVIV